MPLEPKFEYIDDLDPTSPLGTDLYSQGDDHLRGIKSVLTNQFPNLGSGIVTATAEQISEVAALKSAWGGMSLSGGATITLPASNALYTLKLSNATAYPNGVGTTVSPGSGEVIVSGINPEQVKITATLVLNQDSSFTVGNSSIRLLIVRKSNSSAIASGQMTLELPGYNEKVQFTLHALDPTPAASNEGYFIMMTQGFSQPLTFSVLDYHFWIEGRGT